jgi:hypothetical protein
MFQHVAEANVSQCNLSKGATLLVFYNVGDADEEYGCGAAWQRDVVNELSRQFHLGERSLVRLMGQGFEK